MIVYKFQIFIFLSLLVIFDLSCKARPKTEFSSLHEMAVEVFDRIDSEDLDALMKIQINKNEYIHDFYEKSGDLNEKSLSGERFYRHFRIRGRQYNEAKDRVNLFKNYSNIKVLSVGQAKKTIQGDGIKIYKKVPVTVQMKRRSDGKIFTEKFDTILGIVMEKSGRFKLIRILED